MPVKKWRPIVIESRVIRGVSREALELFSHRELKRYARVIGVAPGRHKHETIENLVNSGKASLCATLGT